MPCDQLLRIQCECACLVRANTNAVRVRFIYRRPWDSAALATNSVSSSSNKLYIERQYTQNNSLYIHNLLFSTPTDFQIFTSTNLSLTNLFVNHSTPTTNSCKMGFFSNRYMFAVHMLQITLVLAAIGGSVVRLLIVKAPSSAPRSRANTMALGMVCLYPILSN